MIYKLTTFEKKFFFEPFLGLKIEELNCWTISWVAQDKRSGTRLIWCLRTLSKIFMQKNPCILIFKVTEKSETFPLDYEVRFYNVSFISVSQTQTFCLVLENITSAFATFNAILFAFNKNEVFV